MNICLSELIDRATHCLTDLGFSSGTIRDYQCSAFRPLERRLKNQENISSSILLEQEGFFLKQFQAGKISRHTYNWRIRGIRMLAEVYDTGSFTWKVYSKKKSVSLPELFSSVLCGFVEAQNCGQKRKGCKKSICQRFLKSLIDDGVESFEDIQPEHVRNFIVKISETRPKSMDDVIYALLGCIGRESADGKRDFAAMSLAATSGLRASDIASLFRGVFSFIPFIYTPRII